MVGASECVQQTREEFAARGEDRRIITVHGNTLVVFETRKADAPLEYWLSEAAAKKSIEGKSRLSIREVIL